MSRKKQTAACQGRREVARLDQSLTEDTTNDYFVQVGTASFRVLQRANYARELRRAEMGGADIDDAFQDRSPEGNRLRISRAQKTEAKLKNDAFLLDLGGLLDE